MIRKSIFSVERSSSLRMLELWTFSTLTANFLFPLESVRGDRRNKSLSPWSSLLLGHAWYHIFLQQGKGKNRETGGQVNDEDYLSSSLQLSSSRVSSCLKKLQSCERLWYKEVLRRKTKNDDGVEGKAEKRRGGWEGNCGEEMTYGYYINSNLWRGKCVLRVRQGLYKQTRTSQWGSFPTQNKITRIIRYVIHGQLPYTRRQNKEKWETEKIDRWRNSVRKKTCSKKKKILEPSSVEFRYN